MAQAMADGGEIAAFTLLQAGSPQGAEAKCDFILSVLHAGPAAGHYAVINWIKVMASPPPKT